MLSPLIGQITLGIYAALLAVGGIMGFVKARSHPSLIAGLVSAVAALVALGLEVMGTSFGIPLGLLLSLALFVFFGYRYAAKSRQFMPSGLMSIVSLVVVVVMVLALGGGSGPGAE